MLKCEQCGKEHPRNALELIYKRPDDIHEMPVEQREQDVKETDDQCRTRDGRYFIRGVIPLNVEGREQPYRIGAWAEVDKQTYVRVSELWDDPDQAREPPLPARLANNIFSQRPTLNMPVNLQLTGATSRPDILIPECAHPLHREQCLGITEHRVYEYNRSFAE
jgi:hypothetical protein